MNEFANISEIFAKESIMFKVVSHCHVDRDMAVTDNLEHDPKGDMGE